MPSSSSSSSDSRDLILAAALKLFTQKGVAATSIEDLRRAIGFRSKASLYAHFSGKEAVVDALTAKIVAQMEQVIQHAYANAAPEPLQQLTTTLRAFIHWGMTHPHDYTFRFIRNQQEKLLRGQFDYAQNPMSDSYELLLALFQSLRQHYPVRPIQDAALISLTAGLISRAVIDQDSFGDISLNDKIEQTLELCLGIVFRVPISSPQ